MSRKSPSDVEISEGEGVGGSRAGPRGEKAKIKRRRLQLTCLNCKRRKTKCDKTQPCSSCIARDERDECAYEPGCAPLASPQRPQDPLSSLSTAEIASLKAQMNRIEQQLAASSSASASTSTQATSGLTTTTSAIGPVSKFDRIELYTVPPTMSASSSFSVGGPFPTNLGALRDAKTSLLPPSYAVPIDANHKDKLRNALDGLHALAIQSFPGEKGRLNALPVKDRQLPSAAALGGAEETWPNILKPEQETKQTGRWFRDMAEILDAIPPPAQLAVLTEYYFRKVQGMRYYLCETVLRAEIEQFNEVRYTPDRLQVDPAWLAIIIAVIWVICHYLNDEDSIPYVITEAEFTKSSIRPLAELMFESLNSAMSSSSWVIRPQIRVLQALMVVIGMSQTYIFNSERLIGPPVDASRILWFDIAAGMSKSLKLDTRTSAEDLAALRDPALPPSKPLYSVQTARRIYSHIRLMDTFNLAPFSQTAPYFPDGSFTTPQADNYSEEVLLTAKTVDVPPSHPWEFTTYIWEYHTNVIFAIWRRIRKVMMQGNEMPPYDEVMKVYEEIQSTHQMLLTLKATTKLDAEGLLAFMFVECSYHQRFLHTHRTYLLKSYDEGTYLMSQRICLDAAYKISQNHRFILKNYANHLWVRYGLHLFVHHISAAVVFFVHGFMRPDVRQDMITELSISKEMFASVCLDRVPSFYRGATGGYAVVAQLLDVLADPPELDGDEVIAYLEGIKGRVHQTAQDMIAKHNETKTQMSTPASTTSTLVDPVWGGGGGLKGKDVGMDIYGQPWGLSLDWATSSLGFGF